MLNSVLTYLHYGKYFCGVEQRENSQELTLNATVVVKSKNELNISASFKETSVEGLSKKLPKHQHIVLIINTKKVLSKTVESEQTDAIKLVSSAFPNINLKDFYYEVHSQKSTHFISICRKDYITTLIETYAKHQLSIVNISLGNHSLFNVVEYIQANPIYSSDTKFILDNNELIKIEKGPVISERYDVNGIKVTNNQLLSFSGVLQQILKNNTTNTNFTTEKHRLEVSYKQTRFFNMFIRIGGVFILGLLSVNFLFFNSYFNSINELKQDRELNTITRNQINILDETVSKKQKMIDDLLKSNGSKSSFYSHTIIQSLPKTILLSDYNYQPLLRRIKKGASIELSLNHIVISGTSINSSKFSEWINHLEHIEWITKVTILEYHNTSSKRSNFKISISILHD